MTPPPVSACIIVKNDPHLEACLKSLDGYVSQIVIVDTGSSDDSSQQVAQKYGATFERFTACNDGYGRIESFSMARNRSFALATQPWVLWIDTDDLIGNADKLAELVARPLPQGVQAFSYWLPYEYSYDPTGKCNLRQYRERLIYNRDAFEWQQPVHEVLVPKPNIPTAFVQDDSVVIKHQRQYHAKAQEPGRNLRILQRYFENGGNDTRNKYYIGLEYKNASDIPNAKKYLEEYVKESGWADEKAMALITLGQITNDPNWAYELLKTKPTWFESYYELSRIFYCQNNWELCAHFGQIAATCPPTNSLLFIDHTQRYQLHVYLNVALNNLGRIEEAYQSCLKGLEGMPQHTQLMNNKLIYEKALNIVPPRTSLPGWTFVTHPGLEHWSPDSLHTTGIGGSETMLILLAKELAALGERVTVYAACEGLFDGVQYHPVTEFHNLDCDKLVVSRYAQYLGDDYQVSANLKLLWCHDVAAHGASATLLRKADKVLALSQWHKQNLCQVHHLHPDQVIVTRNGVDLKRFDKTLERNPLKCVNSSSPDRSYPVLLECWKEIKAQVPEAELHLYYGFDNWKKVAAPDPLQNDLIKRLEDTIASTPGVVSHGRVNQDQLANEFLSAGVWLHPTFFTETSCITAMEVQLAGLYAVTSNIAALPETLKGYRQATILDGEWTSPEYKAAFIKAAVDYLNAKRERERSGYHFDIKDLARDWRDMAATLLAEPCLNPYLPTPKYVERTIKPQLVKLNIACGPNLFPYDGWLNYDHADFTHYFAFMNSVQTPAGMPEHQRKLWEWIRDGGRAEYTRHDMTQPFPRIDSSVDFIYVGQAIEHLSPMHQIPAFLAECFRMLKPGGVLRMTTPDLNKLLLAHRAGTMSGFDSDQPDFYKDAPPDLQLALLMYGSAGEASTQHNYEGHQCLYTEQSMSWILERAGFTEVEFTWENCGKRPDVAKEIREEGLSHSLIVEAVKPYTLTDWYGPVIAPSGTSL